MKEQFKDDDKERIGIIQALTDEKYQTATILSLLNAFFNQVTGITIFLIYGKEIFDKMAEFGPATPINFRI